MLKILIDTKKCAGCGFCVSHSSNFFIFDKKTCKAKPKNKNGLINPTFDQLKEIDRVAKNCPAQAIKIIK